MRSFLGLLLILVTVYVGIQIGPAYVANLRLEEFIDDTAHALSRPIPPSEEETRRWVLAEARALNIDLSPQQIMVRRFNNEGVIWADYTVHVDFPLHPMDLHFQPSSRNRKTLQGF